MEHTLSASDKYEIQQNFRRYIRLKERFDTARGAYVTSRASKVWVAGVVALLFALASNFFLGVATGLFAVYFYSMVRSWMHINESEEGVEELDRWFSGKKLKFEGSILYFSNDQLLENPLDPFDEDCYQ